MTHFHSVCVFVSRPQLLPLQITCPCVEVYEFSIVSKLIALVIQLKENSIIFLDPEVPGLISADDPGTWNVMITNLNLAYVSSELKLP